MTQTTDPIITYAMPPGESLGDAPWLAVQGCGAKRVKLPVIPFRPQPTHGWEPCAELVEIDLTDAIRAEVASEPRWVGERIKAQLKAVVIVDEQGNEIPGARVVARYDMSTTD